MHNSDLKSESSLELSEEKSKVLTQIKQSYKSGIRYYRAGDLTLAGQKFADAVKPVLSKSDRKSLYVDIEDCKEEALEAMHYLGKIYLASNQCFNNYAKAAGIFQYCAGFAAKYKIGNPDGYLAEAYLVQDKFLENLDQKENADKALDITSKLAWYKEESDQYKDSLAYIRKEVAEQIKTIRDWPIEEIARRAKVVEEIYKECTNSFVNNGRDKEQNPGLIQKMIGSCIKQLGPVPEGCEYSFIGFGSLAGGRMTPWSDLEFAVLINEDKEEYKEYFRNLTKLLNIKVVNLGETPLRSLGVEALNNFKTANAADEWFYDDVLKSGFSFDGPDWHACKLPLGRQGGYKVQTKGKTKNGTEQEIIINKPDFELILIPKQLAEFQLEVKEITNTELDFNKQEPTQEQESWYKSDMHLVQSIRLVSLIDGSQKLIDDYRAYILNIERLEIIQNRTTIKLQEDLANFSLKLGYKEEGKLIDVKKDIFRIGDRIIDDLANYFGITAKEEEPIMTAWEAIDKMQEREILSQEGVQHLKEALSISTELRLATYCHNQGQNETISTYQLAVEHLNEIQKKKLLEETFYIKDSEILHYFYYVMLRAQKLVHNFCSQEYYTSAELILKTDELFDDSNYNKGMVHSRFLEYDKALEFMETAAQEQPNDTNLLYHLLYLYQSTSSIKKAIVLANKILVILKSKYAHNTSHPDIATIYDDLGSVYKANDKYEKAIQYYQRALEIKLQAYCDNPNHPAIAASYNNLGYVYNAQGKYEKAIQYYQKALEIRKQKAYEHSPWHLDIATSYNNLGDAYSAQGKYEKAIQYYQRALEIKLQAYCDNPNHPAIAASYNNLGAVFEAKREYEKAIQYYQKALEIRQKVYGHSPWHLDIAASYNNLGTIYRAQAEYEKGINCYNQALEIMHKVYKQSPNHSAVAGSYNNLGNIYNNKSEYKKAINCYTQALEIMHKVYKQSPNHSAVAGIYHNLGNTYSRKGKYKKAIEFHHKALEIMKKSLGEDHPDVATSLNNIGCTYAKLGQHEKALNYQEQALEIMKKSLGEDHPDVATSLNNIGGTYGSLGKHEEALNYQEQALEIMKKSLGEDHPDVATSLHNIGMTYGFLGKYEKALNYLTQTLEIMKKSLGENHPNTIRCKLNIYHCNNLNTTVYNDKTKYEATKSLNEKITILSSKGINAYNQQNYGEAIEEYSSALKLVDEFLSYDLGKDKNITNINTKAKLYYNIARAYHSNSNLEQALFNYNEAYQINDKHDKAREYFYECAETLCLQQSAEYANDSLVVTDGIMDNTILGNSERYI